MQLLCLCPLEIDWGVYWGRVEQSWTDPLVIILPGFSGHLKLLVCKICVLSENLIQNGFVGSRDTVDHQLAGQKRDLSMRPLHQETTMKVVDAVHYTCVYIGVRCHVVFSSIPVSWALFSPGSHACCPVCLVIVTLPGHQDHAPRRVSGPGYGWCEMWTYHGACRHSGESTVCFTVDFPLEIQILLQFVYVIIWMFCLITTNFSTYTGSAKFYGDVTCIWIHRSTFLVSLERNVESLCEGGPSRMSADALVPFDVRASPAIC